jgi:hypothetical protein
MSSAMKLQREMPPSQFAVRIGPQELGQIITLRKNLDHMGVLARFAEQYLKLGWSLAALDVATGADLGLDFTLPKKAWVKRLMDVSLAGHEVNLAVPAQASAWLFAVKVRPEKGGHRLDRFGPWRSTCVAAAGNTWEQHFFLWPPDWCLSSFGLPEPENPEIEVLGEGKAALAPPAIEPDSEETWRWLKPPWETPPCPPPDGLWRFLKKHGAISPASLTPEPHLPSWKETFVRISHHNHVLRALLSPPASPARYYQEIIKEALKAGLREPETLQALLWHAPHGEVRRHPERWRPLLKAVGELARAPLAPGRPSGARNLGTGARGPVPAGSSQPVAPGLPPPEQESRSRKSLLDQLDRLTARTLELERQLTTLQKTPTSKETVSPARPKEAIPFWEDWLALIQRPGLEERERLELRAAVATFLAGNPDLAGDEGKIHLVLYCYTNYVKINPAFAGLPYETRLCQAGEIARSFLKSPAF